MTRDTTYSALRHPWPVHKSNKDRRVHIDYLVPVPGWMLLPHWIYHKEWQHHRLAFLIRNRFPQFFRFRHFRSEYPERETDLFDIFDRILVMKKFITPVNKTNKSENNSKISLDRSDVTRKIWVTGVKVTPKIQFTGVIYRSYHSHSCHFDIPDTWELSLRLHSIS